MVGATISEALLLDRERIISKIQATFDSEIDSKRLKIKPSAQERIEHILNMIYFNIKNPDYKRKSQEELGKDNLE